MAKRPMKDVIVLLPGITGSVLRKEGKDVWAISPGAVANALFSLGRDVKALELRDDDADDGVTAPQLISDLHLFPGLWKIDGYTKVSQYIQEHFDATLDQNFFPFPYDWRRDNRFAARLLKEQTERWLYERRRDVPDAKLILVGHSMGGLVARYFLECLDGWRDTRMLVTFGTPYRGSLQAFDFVVNGMKKKLGPVPLLDASRMLRSFPSTYQLMPIYPCFDPGDRKMVRVAETTGVANLDLDRAKAALEFHREIESAVSRHLNDEQYRRDRYAIHPVVGTFQPTLLSAVRSGDRVVFVDSHPDQDPDGDSTVPRVSATPIEFPHEEGAMFSAERHGSLQNNDGVLVQLAGILSGRDTSKVRAGFRLGLRLDDAYGVNEPIAFGVRSEDPMAELTAVIIAANPGAEVARIPLEARSGWRTAETAPLPVGSYRVAITGEGVDPVTDFFVVLGPEEPGGPRQRQRRIQSTRGAEATRLRESEIDAIVGGSIERSVSGEQGGVPETAPSPQPVLDQRYLAGRFPEHVRLGDTASLVAWIAVQTAERLSARLQPIAIPPAGVEIVLNLVDHPGFKARSPERMPLTVVAGKDSPPVSFDLAATTEGVHTLRLEAFLGGTHLGGLQVEATVDADIRTGEAVQQTAPVGGRAKDPGEISLLIHYDADKDVYRYQLIDWSGDVPDESTSDQLLQTPSKAIEELVKQLNAVARDSSPWDARTTNDWLKNQGIALWKGFVPASLRAEYWSRRDRITKMTVISSGDPVPWELLYPFDGADRDAGFLVDQFPVARRRFGVQPPNRLRITSAGVVSSGQQTLASVPAEIKTVTDFFDPRDVTVVDDVPTLLDLFKSAKFGLLHFACHNAFAIAAPNASRIMIGAQPFEPVFLEQHEGKFTQSSPLVFINACRTDGQAPLYTTVEGWASSFLRAGAGVFIGSLWEVVDTSARTYAEVFYKAVLTDKKNLGEAARLARAAIRNKPGDPTWLAYTMYGDPGATLV